MHGGEIVETYLPMHLTHEFVDHLQNLEKETETRFQELKNVCQLNFVVDSLSATQQKRNWSKDSMRKTAI